MLLCLIWIHEDGKVIAMNGSIIVRYMHFHYFCYVAAAQLIITSIRQ